MEAINCSVPVVAFENSGAVPVLLRAHKAGAVAGFTDIDNFRKKLFGLLNHDKLQAGRTRLMGLAATEFAFAPYARNLLKLVQPSLKKIRVCVMNYNYARYLRPRLQSVFAQTHPVAEILLFDDGLADESDEIAQALAVEFDREMRVIANARNAGAVFAQWQQAVDATLGEYSWIAEADDACAPEFLRCMIEAMDKCTHAVMGFCDSRMIDAAGEMTSPDYKSHYREAGATMLLPDGA